MDAQQGSNRLCIFKLKSIKRFIFYNQLKYRDTNAILKSIIRFVI